MSRLGEKVKVIRVKKGITQKQLGNKIGVSESFIYEIETGKRIINDSIIKRLTKVLGENIEDTVLFEYDKNNDANINSKIESKPSNNKKEALTSQHNKTWEDAFSSILKTVPVYDYNLEIEKSFRQLPIVSNKVEGYSKDKVIFIEIEDNEMLGFRIAKGDIALAYLTHDIENNAISLIEVSNRRMIRQLKKIDKDKVLLISNQNVVLTETASLKELKVMARLIKVEIKL